MVWFREQVLRRDDGEQMWSEVLAALDAPVGRQRVVAAPARRPLAVVPSPGALAAHEAMFGRGR